MTALVWFRNDLRTHDHAALAAATRSGNKNTVGVFIICPHEWEMHSTAPVRIHFILNNLSALREKLTSLNIPLQILVADKYALIPTLLTKFALEISASACHFILEYPVNERARDARAIQLLTKQGIATFTYHQQCLIAPGEVLTREGGFFKVFSQFKKTWIQTAASKNWIIEKPKTVKEPYSIALNPVPYHLAPKPTSGPESWSAGEQVAQKKLKLFSDHKMRDYKNTRDFPALEGTSSLSPYLAVGAISARTCLIQALSLNEGRFQDGNSGIDAWINELIWRDFYQHIVFGFPHVCKNKPFKLETMLIEWNTSEKQFNAWCQGQTGFPLVDAAMRQLLATGWMHNRLRMLTAMFLTKNLFIDWQKGETFFMQHLIDGDFAANNGGWQWSASTGTDAAPYFRMFNPILQSERFDPDGQLIRRWIPELANCTTKTIHDPSRNNDLFGRNDNYPQPIIDLKNSKQRVVSAFKSLQEAKALLITT